MVSSAKNLWKDHGTFLEKVTLETYEKDKNKNLSEKLTMF